MKIYVAGPMSNLPQLNHPMFDRVTAALRNQGHTVFSPAEKDRDWGLDPNLASNFSTLDVHMVLRWDLQKIMECDVLVLLPGWKRSEGTKLEVIVAISTGRQIFYWSEAAQSMFGLPLSETTDIPGIPSYARKVPAS